MDEQTKNYAWEVIEDETKIVRDSDNRIYEEICTIKRKYTHEHSNVPLQPYEKLELNIGYKVYKSPTYVFPEYSGHRNKVFWTVADPPEAGSAAFSIAASLVAVSLALAF